MSVPRFVDKKWKCTECSYSMDSATCPRDPTATPDDGDLTICLNCGHLYIRKTDTWVEPSVDDYLSLPQEIKAYIEKARRLRKEVVTKDLTQIQRGTP